MLIEFSEMKENEMYRLVHEIYAEASLAIAKEKCPEHRLKGYAASLIGEVLAALKTRGRVTIRSNVNKNNVASLATHKKCGFKIELENGVNCLTGEERESVYGMIYEG